MRSTLLAALVLSAGPVLAQGQVDPAIHKLCIEAKDYAGCVRAMKGESLPASRVVNSQGADVVEGNSCPAGFAYVGGGNCQEVKCSYNSSGFNALGHDSLIAGLKDKNGKDIWGCKYSFWHGAGVLRLTGGILRTSQNNDCPAGEPQRGFNNTCQTASKDFETPAAQAAREEREGPKCDFKLKAYKCSFNAYLDANPGMKKWAELNPELAQKERVKLQSVD